MSFKLALTTAFVILGVILGALVVVMRLAAEAGTRVAVAEQRRYESYKLADELRQSSDDLTRMARSYVATGDLAFQQRYDLILGIRNGTRPRPLNYDHADWGWVPDSTQTGRAMSLEQRMRNEHFADSEFAILREARHQSDELVTMEERAMQMITPAAGAPPIAAEVREQAREMLYSPDYCTAKATIMARIDEFFVMLESRTRREIRKARNVQLGYLATAWSLGLLAVAVCVGAFSFLTNRVVKPVSRLVAHARELAAGHYHQRTEVAGCKELVVLADTFNTMSDAIEADIVHRTAIQHELEIAKQVVDSAYGKLRTDLDAAAKVQRSLLPDMMPDISGLSFAYAYQPCDQLGGDTLNVLEMDDDHIVLYLIDVSGHGVQAALLASTLSHLLTSARDSLLWTGDPERGEIRLATPQEVADRLNRRFPFNPELNQYFTIHYGVLDVRTRLYRFISGGHPRPILLSPGKPPEVVAASGPGIGILPNPVFTETEIQLGPGDRLFFFSDGMLEAANPNGVEFQDGGLLESLGKLNGHSLDATLNQLLLDVQAWVGTPHLDDISAVGLEIGKE